MKFIFLLVASFAIGCTTTPPPPAAYGPTPNEAQLQWHDVDFYAMITLSLNTYTDVEWGYGNEDIKQFNPYQFNADSMVSQIKAAGMKGVLLVAKHHNGFCLWPTSTTEYSVTNSPWKDGKGDMVREFADACRVAGLKFGIYVSPWDRNDADYGKEGYLERYRTQIKELHTGYGELFLSWYDGANGGDGYYGGANEERKIDKHSYYNWPELWGMIKEMQPKAAIFGDVGPDVRWVGNESGFGAETCWATFTPKGIADEAKPANGDSRYWEAPEGHRDGKYWLPAECDVPLRPGWFYHATEDNYVKSAGDLFDLYFMSVGRGCNLDIGLAPNREGVLHQSDVESLAGIGKLLRGTFAENLAENAKIKASNVRGKSSAYAVENLTDSDKSSYYATDDDVKDAVIDITFDKPTRFNIFSISEYINLGQRLDSIAVEVCENGAWREFGRESSIGAKRLIRKNPTEASAVRVTLWGAVSPAVAELGLYLEPEQLGKPTIVRNREGYVSITGISPTLNIHYTLDGSEPKASSERYTSPLLLPDGGMIRAAAFNEKGESGAITSSEFGVIKSGWSTPDKSQASAIDDNIRWVWEAKPSHSLIIDLGVETCIDGFVYTPAGDMPIIDYEFYVSNSPTGFSVPVSKGRFNNIVNNPLPQTIRFDRVYGRYVKLKAVKTASPAAYKVAEFDILGQMQD